MEVNWLVNDHCAVQPQKNLSAIEERFQTNKELSLATAECGKLIDFDHNTNHDLRYKLDPKKDQNIYFRPHAGTYFKDLNWMVVPIDEILCIQEQK